MKINEDVNFLHPPSPDNETDKTDYSMEFSEIPIYGWL